MDDYFEKPNKSRYTVLVIYDISDNPRRYRVNKLLRGYGTRVQRSAFECVLSNRKYNKLIGSIERIISEGDLVRIYKLTENTEVRIWGDTGRIEYDDFLIF